MIRFSFMQNSIRHQEPCIPQLQGWPESILKKCCLHKTMTKQHKKVSERSVWRRKWSYVFFLCPNLTSSRGFSSTVELMTFFLGNCFCDSHELFDWWLSIPLFSNQPIAWPQNIESWRRSGDSPSEPKIYCRQTQKRRDNKNEQQFQHNQPRHMNIT